MIEPDLERISDVIVEELAEVQADENVLVLTDVELEPFARPIANASRRLGAETFLTVMRRIDRYGSEPPAPIAEMMRAVDLTVSVLATSLTHTDARREAAETGTRTFIIRGVNFDTMVRGGINTDYVELHRVTAAVKETIDDGATIHVASPAGTDVTMDVEGRSGFILDGRFGDGVRLTNGVPTGEAPVAPVEGSAEGTIVIDYSMDNIGRVEEPIALTLEAGRVTDVGGGESADRLAAILDEGDSEARNLAEFAIGTNPDARLTGILAEDKKKAGTVHFAVGDNMSLGGTVRSDLHLDGMVLEPTVTIDGETVVESGSLRP